MNGVGWLCDACGKTEVVQGDHWQQMGPGQPPDGWYLLFKAAPERAASNERWEFCSLICLHEQTRPFGTDTPSEENVILCANPGCGKPMSEHGRLAECWPTEVLP